MSHFYQFKGLLFYKIKNIIETAGNVTNVNEYV